MNITNTKTTILKWEYDMNIFTDGNKDFILKTDQEITYYPIIGLSKSRKNAPIKIGIGWAFDIFYIKKIILSFHVEDDYITTISNRGNEDLAITDMINDSIQRFRDAFNDKKKEIGIIDRLPDFPNDRRVDLKQQIIQHLNKRLNEPLL